MLAQKASIVFVVCLASCGGRMMSVEQDGGLGPPHDSPCTESDCTSSVQVIANLDGYQTAPADMFVAGGFVYVAQGSLLRVPIDGGQLTSFVDDENVGVEILGDEQDVYWNSGCNDGDSVFELSHSGGTPVGFATRGGPGSYCDTSFFVDSSAVYWTVDAQSLHARPIDGGTETVTAFPREDALAPTVLVDGRMLRDDCTGIDVSSAGAIVAGHGMVADSGHCYELHGDCGQPYACGDIVSIPMGGGPTTVLVKASSPSSQEFVTSRMMVDELGFYLIERYAPGTHDEQRALIRVPFDGGSPVRLTSDPVIQAYDVAPDRIYWLTANAIKSMPKYKQ